jgi:hypothetical protein
MTDWSVYEGLAFVMFAFGIGLILGFALGRSME